jgi:hypothetical protein
MNYFRLRRKLIESINFDERCLRRKKLIDKVKLKVLCDALTLDKLTRAHNLDRELELLQNAEVKNNHEIKTVTNKLMRIKGIL